MLCYFLHHFGPSIYAILSPPELWPLANSPVEKSQRSTISCEQALSSVNGKHICTSPRAKHYEQNGKTKRDDQLVPPCCRRSILQRPESCDGSKQSCANLHKTIFIFPVALTFHTACHPFTSSLKFEEGDVFFRPRV